MEKVFAEKISQHTGIEYFKIYILLYEYIRYLWGRALAGVSDNFQLLFAIRPYNEEGYTHALRSLIKNKQYDDLILLVIDTAFARACYLKETKQLEGKKTRYFYKRLQPLDYDKNVYWRIDKVQEEAKELNYIYRKFKLGVYKTIHLNTKLEVEFYEYCKHIYEQMLNERLMRVTCYTAKRPVFKLKVVIKYDKAI